MARLRVLVFEEKFDSDDEHSGVIFVGQALEHDLCVQGYDVDDVLRRMQHQVAFYTTPGAYGHSNDGLSSVPPAPDEYFHRWEDMDYAVMRKTIDLP